jgi:hypothetical protein
VRTAKREGTCALEGNAAGSTAQAPSPGGEGTRTRWKQTVLWRQFPGPLAPAYITTQNDCQRLCMSRVAIDWNHPEFSYGQLSTASSRARVSTNCVTVLLPESDFCTPNAVYQELLVHPITYNVARALRLCCSVSCSLFQFPHVIPTHPLFAIPSARVDKTKPGVAVLARVRARAARARASCAPQP